MISGAINDEPNSLGTSPEFGLEDGFTEQVLEGQLIATNWPEMLHVSCLRREHDPKIDRLNRQ